MICIIHEQYETFYYYFSPLSFSLTIFLTPTLRNGAEYRDGVSGYTPKARQKKAAPPRLVAQRTYSYSYYSYKIALLK